jgi:hypothetical protein
LIKNSIKFLMVFILAIGLTSLATAQGSLSGSVTGKVSDTEGNPLPGCTVTLEGIALQGQMTFVSTEAGQYRFPAVPPGENYQLTFEMPGFKTVVRQGLNVSIGKASNINITLEMSTLEEEVTVVGESPTVDVKVSKTAVNYSKSYIYNIPMARDLYEVLNSMPGSVSENVSYRRTSYMAGGTVRGNQYSIDGVTINDPVVMYPMTNVNIDVYEEVEMGMFGHSADVGIADGGYVNIVTKSGGNAFHGGGTVEYYNEDMQKYLITEEDLTAVGLAKPTGWNTWQDFSLFLGGPIIKDKIWFFANGRYFKWQQDFNHIIYDDTIAQGGRVYTLDQAPHKESNMFGKLTFQLSSNIRFLATYNLTMITEDFYTNRVGSNLDVTSTTKWDGEMGHTVSAQLNWVASQNLFFDIRAGYIRRFFPIPYSAYAIADAPQFYDRYYGIYRNNPRFEETYLRERLNPSVQATLFVDNALGGSHEFKFGAEYEFTSGNWDWWRQNPFRIYYYAGGPSYPTATEPNRYRIYSYICGSSEGSSVQENTMTRIGAYIQDSFTIGERLTLNLGVRFDTSNGKFPEQYHGASADPYGLLATLGQSTFSEYTLPEIDVLTWTHFSPRLGFAYDPFGDGKTSIRGSWSRYNEYLMIQYFSLPNPNYPNSGGWYWYDDNENGIIDPSADRFELRYLPPDPFTFDLKDQVDTDCTAPYTDEFAVGIERELARDFSAGVTFVYKHKQNIFEDVNDYGLGKDEAWKGYAENSPYWERFDFLDPGDDGEFGTGDDQQSYCYVELAGAPDIHYYFTNVQNSSRKYWALQFIFNKRMSNNWQMLASYVYSKAYGNIGGNYNASYGASGGFDTPNAFVFNGGRLDYDRPHNIKIQSTVILPYEFIVSGYFNHYSGSPWQRSITVYVPDSPTHKWTGDLYGVNTELNGTRRNAPATTLDMRVEKRFRIGETFSIGAYIDIINLMARSGFNITGNPGGYVHQEDPNNPYFERFGTYGNITGAYGQRVYKISLRFTF